ncbi:hypothetical protein T01_3978 [Trichinella spiralis]|uniref:Uncharacterized protein n=1 Tax=Trichinella spiralis TaxID=6334 RepID=A0A0V1B9H7_TRISP|nr:hypothetical protein T01_3978 [Trichinella spiralis]
MLFITGWKFPKLGRTRDRHDHKLKSVRLNCPFEIECENENNLRQCNLGIYGNGELFNKINVEE